MLHQQHPSHSARVQMMVGVMPSAGGVAAALPGSAIAHFGHAMPTMQQQQQQQHTLGANRRAVLDMMAGAHNKR